MSLKLAKTCERCPEQYDVLANGEKVAYIRLRFGNLTAEIGDKEVYYHKFDNEFKGEFETDEERKKYLSEILEVLNEQICKTV